MNNRIGFFIFGGIGALCLAICAILFLIALHITQEQQHYLAGSCTITSKQLLEQFPSSTSSSTSHTPTYAPHFEFVVRTADGRRYTASGYDGTDTYTSSPSSQQDILDSFAVGQTYPCWYDGANPSHAVLARNPMWGLFFAAGVLLVVGAVFVFSSLLMLLGRVSWVAIPRAGGYSWRGEAHLFGNKAPRGGMWDN